MIATRMTALLLAMAPLTGCGIDFHPQKPGDTACLDSQVDDFGTLFYQAIQICGTPVPDLTGDVELQQYAQAYDIPYRYQPALDAAIKRHDFRTLLLVGSQVPEQRSLNAAELGPQ